jgi:hypothetical protein
MDAERAHADAPASDGGARRKRGCLGSGWASIRDHPVGNEPELFSQEVRAAADCNVASFV